MTTPKRHHFVPRWYLEGFVEAKSGLLNVYDRKTKSFRRQKPREVMTIGRYYRQDWAPTGVDPDIFEKALGSKIEPNAKKALERLINAPTEATAEDTAAILIYLESQRIRVPRQAETAKNLLMTVSLLHFPPELATALLKGQITISDGFRFDFMRMMTGQLHPFFSRMAWEVIEAEEGCSFVTSDSPVSFFNVAFVPPNEPGPGLLGTIVIFPIKSKYLLIMRHPEYVAGGQRSPIERIPEPQEREGGIYVTYGDKWNKQKVHRQNWTMFQLSHRLIVGNSRAAVQRAVEDDPE